MITDKEKLDFCKICLKRKFNPNKGIVCSLTDEKPNFSIECENYDVDTYQESKENSKKVEGAYGGFASETSNEASGMSNAKIAWSVFITLLIIARIIMRFMK